MGADPVGFVAILKLGTRPPLSQTTQTASAKGDPADVLIVGGGIIGVAVAWQMTRMFPGRGVALLEKESTLAAHQTGHNSGVIHSGIYYRPGSAKAKHCVRGAAMMREFCAANDVPHRICGKLVVARAEREIPRLEELHRRGTANGVAGLELVGPERMAEIEPHVAGLRGMWVPVSGIVDYVRVTHVLADQARERGAVIHTGRAHRAVRAQGDGVEVTTDSGPLRARFLVNCGGLQADRIARGATSSVPLRIVPFRGEYYDLAPHARGLVRGLIYPVPDPDLPFLGVHFTTRVDGTVEAGPNAVLTWRREGYRRGAVSGRDVADTLSWPGFWKMAAANVGTGIAELYRSLSKAAFVRDLQGLIPEVRAEDLVRGGAGVRAQAVDRRGALLDDFALVESERALHVLNAPSPAATASLSIAEEIVTRAGAQFGL